jgi:hypothetical protein
MQEDVSRQTRSRIRRPLLALAVVLLATFVGSSRAGGAHHSELVNLVAGRRADKIGHLLWRLGHLLVLWRLDFQLQRIQRTRGGIEMALGEVQIDRGLFQIAVTQQQLDRAQVSTGFCSKAGG